MSRSVVVVRLWHIEKASESRVQCVTMKMAWASAAWRRSAGSAEARRGRRKAMYEVTRGTSSKRICTPCIRWR